MTQRGRGGRGTWPILTLLALLAATLTLLELVERRRPGGGRTATTSRSAHRPFRRSAADHPPGAVPQRSPDGRTGSDPDWIPEAGSPTRVAIVIDDVGFEEGPALELSRLGIPLTFAILPRQRYSKILAEKLRSGGHEVILHLPMEPIDYPHSNPGAGAVAEGMEPGEIATAVLRDLEDVPGAVGLNNHMGSRATADAAVMRAVLEVARARGLYFLDSRTTTETIGFEMARNMGVPAIERTIFLDDRREASYIEGQVRGLLRRAREGGAAVAIGHPDPVTVKVLEHSVGLLRSEGIQVVPVSQLVLEARRGSG
ncbi:MAG TPA: divergent polysaccharide deacetylase family protein [Candidatus Polarisedimenticolia bacterium]|nr:divergent polysaccharide deacetylase family protein [Candidatus Polarisedimenticolia bacterium]